MTTRLRACGCLCGAVLTLAASAQAGLLSYWPLDEGSGGTAFNAVAGGTDGTLVGPPTWITNDPVRGTVLSFNGSTNYVDAGVLPALSLASEFTWSFWTYQVSGGGGGNNVALGNRYDAAHGGNNWIKFTPTKLEYVAGGTNNPVDYVDIPNGEWVYHVAVKKGATMQYYRNGVYDRSTTLTVNVPSVPFYMGGDKYGERWSGRIDDVALWDTALPAAAIRVLGRGAASPGFLSHSLVFSDDFSGSTIDPTKWQVIQKGLESPPGGATITNPIADTTTNPGALTLGGQSVNSYWNGETARTVQSFGTGLPTYISVDRVSIAGSGSPRRSGLWLWADNDHYLLFSQNIGEGGWQYNLKDVGGVGGTGSATGTGVNIGAFDGLDSALGLSEMELVWMPEPGGAEISMYLNGVFGTSVSVSNFPDTFQVMLSAMPRASGDTVTVVFDNFGVAVVPEPATLSLLALGGLGLLRRRRRNG